MRNSQRLIVGLLTLALVASLMVPVFAGASNSSYWDKLGQILDKEALAMEAFANDLSKFADDIIGVDEMIEKAKLYRKKFNSNLQELIMLAVEAPNQDLHTKIVSVLSGYYLAVDIYINGLREREVEKVKLAMNLMQQVNKKLEKISGET